MGLHGEKPWSIFLQRNDVDSSQISHLALPTLWFMETPLGFLGSFYSLGFQYAASFSFLVSSIPPSC